MFQLNSPPDCWRRLEYAELIGATNIPQHPKNTRFRIAVRASFHLGSAALVLGFVREGDLYVIRMSEMRPKHPVIMTDVSDFRIYRRGRREAILLVQEDLPPFPFVVQAYRRNFV